MKYETFEALFIKQNKQLRIVLAIAVLLLISILFFIVTDKKYFVLKNSSLVDARPLLTWACEEAFISTAKGKPIPDLISDSILNELKKSEFKVSVDEVISSIEFKKDTCRLIVKSDGRIRSFLISFESNKDFAFFYKLSEITETEVNYDELSKMAGSK